LARTKISIKIKFSKLELPFWEKALTALRYLGRCEAVAIANDDNFASFFGTTIKTFPKSFSDKQTFGRLIMSAGLEN